MAKASKKPEPRKQSAAERWLAILPKPPLGETDEGVVEIWLRRCLEAGGGAALTWVYRPENWPLGAYMRGRVQHIYGMLLREEEATAKAAIEAAAREGQQSAVDAERELKRRAGWAV